MAAVDDFSGIPAPDSSMEFLPSLKERREPETSAKDSLKTQALVRLAEESSKAGHMLQSKLHRVGAAAAE